MLTNEEKWFKNILQEKVMMISKSCKTNQSGFVYDVFITIISLWNNCEYHQLIRFWRGLL